MQKKHLDIEAGKGGQEGRYEWISDERVAAYNAYIERKSRIPDLVGTWQVVAVLVGVAIAVLMMSLPFILHMAVIERDHALTSEVMSSVAFMGDEEKSLRLMEAQRHNASVSGWGGWPASVDNEGMAGASKSLTDDIQVPYAEEPEELPFDEASPLDVGDGLIGWVSIPTGRTVPMIDDRVSERYSQMGRLSWERWSCLPVGGHGTLCVLTLSDGDSSSVIEDDLGGIQVGDSVVIGALGDMYAYRVTRMESGSQADVMEKVIKRAGDDSIAILVGKDGDGTMTAMLANRTRYEGVREWVLSPTVEACRKQMVTGMSVGLLSVTLFLLAWKFKRDDRKAKDALEREELRAFHDASEERDRKNGRKSDDRDEHAPSVKPTGEDDKATGEGQGKEGREGPTLDGLDDLDLGLVAKYAMRGVSQDVVANVMQRVAGDGDADAEADASDEADAGDDQAEDAAATAGGDDAEDATAMPDEGTTEDADDGMTADDATDDVADEESPETTSATAGDDVADDATDETTDEVIDEADSETEDADPDGTAESEPVADATVADEDDATVENDDVPSEQDAEPVADLTSEVDEEDDADDAPADEATAELDGFDGDEASDESDDSDEDAAADMTDTDEDPAEPMTEEPSAEAEGTTPESEDEEGDSGDPTPEDGEEATGEGDEADGEDGHDGGQDADGDGDDGQPE